MWEKMEVDSETNDDVNKENEPETESAIVAKILKFAKLDVKTVNPNIQQVFFGKPLLTEEIKLLELNPQVTDHLENGGKLVLKGTATDNCVLCTENQTFDVKDTEISNALLIVSGASVEPPQDKFDNQLFLSDIAVNSVCHSYLELKPIKPMTNVLLSLLKDSVYEGPDQADTNILNYLTLNDIMSTVPASDNEIRTALIDLNTLEIDGYVRLVDFDYMSRVVGSVTALLEENSWTFDSFSRTQTVDVLSGLYPKEIINHALTSYGASKAGAEETDLWSLDEDKVKGY